MTWDFASNKKGEPDIVLAACGDYAAEESLCAIKFAKDFFPNIKLRFVYVSELSEYGVGNHKIAQDHTKLDKYFTPDRPIIFNFHGYPHTLHKILFYYAGCERLSVHGYHEHGSTTAPLDMHVRNKTSRYHLLLDIAEHALEHSLLSPIEYAESVKAIRKSLAGYEAYILKNEDDPERLKHWKW